MPTLRFLALNPTGHYQTIHYSANTLETLLDVLTRYVCQGWQLIYASYIDADYHFIPLPIAAFDGQPLSSPLEALQEEWEAILGIGSPG